MAKGRNFFFFIREILYELDTRINITITSNRTYWIKPNFHLLNINNKDITQIAVTFHLKSTSFKSK